MPREPILRLDSLSKRFGGVSALTDVSFDVQQGSIHAVVGENGAGKSTLMKLLVGVHQPDSGEMWFGGAPRRFGDPGQARACGIDIVFQEIEIPGNLTVAEGLFLGREPRHGPVLDHHAMFVATGAAVRQLGVTIAPDTMVDALSIAEKQLVQFARALVGDCRLLILDEPSSALSDHEVERMFGVIQRLREAGTTIVYVSHRLEEIFRLADTITVLRDGRHIATRARVTLTHDELVGLMAGAPTEGRDWDQGPPRAATQPSGPLIIDARAVSRPPAFTDVSFSVAAGEIVGLFGIVGAGRTEVARVLFGLDHPSSGALFIEGREVHPRGPADAIAAGLALVPEDRKAQGLLLEASLIGNCSLAALPRLTHAGVISSRDEWRLASEAVGRLRIIARDFEIEVRNLSGGNQQKTVIARWLATSPRALILDEPTKGIDVGAKREVYRIIHELAGTGMAVLVITSELDEALTLPDRLLVMRRGRIAAELLPNQATREQILSHAV